MSGLHHVSVMPTMRGLEERRKWRSGILLHMDLALNSTTVSGEVLMLEVSKGLAVSDFLVVPFSFIELSRGLGLVGTNVSYADEEGM